MNERNDKGLSDALGAVVLISVVALGVTLAGVAILSGPLPDRMPALNAEVTNTSDAIFIRHTGGDPLVRGEYRILVDGSDRTSDFLSGSAVPAQWSVGDVLRYDLAGAPMPDSVQIVAITGNGEHVILQVQVQPPTLRPASTIPPTATPTSITTIPTSTTTTTITTTASTTTQVPPPLADFRGTPLSGTVPLMVVFTDISTNSPTSWSWNFGDGGTSTNRNPTHQYLAAGTYTVTLTATNAGGSNLVTKTGYITVSPSLIASFTWKEDGKSGSVQFTDTSAGGPTSWSWTFGDGGTSTQQGPKHKYGTTGTFNVWLTITRSPDGATNTTHQLITVI